MREIVCGGSGGGVVLVDDEDYERVAQYTWTIDWNGYATRRFQDKSVPSIRRKELIHRFILDAPAGTFIDHINRNKLDNRRCNLRHATHRQNNANRPTPRGTSRYKGIFFDAKKKRWVASIMEYGKTTWLGQYVNEEDAAKAYDKEAFVRWGEFAYLNFPEEIAK